MIGEIYLGVILIFFILAFAIRNLKTYLSTKQSIKGKSIKLTLSILISTCIYGLILLRLTYLNAKVLLELDFSDYKSITYLGFIFVTAGFILGILALIAMKNSWRVGIKYDQKTELIKTGIYKISRNPYFFSYDLLIFGYILIFPSFLLLILYIFLTITFHRMILEEEKYLESIHGDTYLEYRKRVKRYVTINLFS
jgi:protein-S-isoprenylcysteine O-methyltransferase Ste14